MGALYYEGFFMPTSESLFFPIFPFGQILKGSWAVFWNLSEVLETKKDNQAERSAPSVVTTWTDGDLVRKALGGNSWAEGQLYRRHVQSVMNTALMLLGHRAEAEDVVHESFVIALEKLKQLKEPEAFRGWLVQIAVRQVRRRTRRKKILKWVGLSSEKDTNKEDEVRLDHLANQDASPEVLFELRKMHEKLHQLSEDERMIWILRYIDEEDIDSIAKFVDSSRSTVKRRLATINDHLRSEILMVRLES